MVAITKILACDGCGAEFRVNQIYKIHQMRAMSRQMGWSTCRDAGSTVQKDWCPECRKNRKRGRKPLIHKVINRLK